MKRKNSLDDSIEENESESKEEENEDEENENESENNIEPEIDDLLRKRYQNFENAEIKIKKLNENFNDNNSKKDIVDTSKKMYSKDKKLNPISSRENIDASLKK